MAYEEELAARVRLLLGRRRDFVEKRMFGGIALMVGGHMCCGVVKDRMMARVGPDAYEKALELAHAEPMDFTGRPMKGFVYVDAMALGDDELDEWIGRCEAFVGGLERKV